MAPISIRFERFTVFQASASRGGHDFLLLENPPSKENLHEFGHWQYFDIIELVGARAAVYTDQAFNLDP